MTRPILSVSEVFIVTKRLQLRKYEGDLPAIQKMVKWLNDPEVTKYSEQRHRKHDVHSQLEHVYGPVRFREIHTADAFIGTIAAHVDENNSVANVGILIGEKKEWGKGYGTEAWQAFCDYLLANGIRKIEAGAMASNLGMISIFKKTGMHAEGVLEAHFLLNGKEENCWQWARFK